MDNLRELTIHELLIKYADVCIRMNDYSQSYSHFAQQKYLETSKEARLLEHEAQRRDQRRIPR